MKTAYFRSLIALVATLLFNLGTAQAGTAQKGLPLKALAGAWAGTGSATFAICFNSDFSAVEDCSTAPNSAYFNQDFVFQQTVDLNGNSCATIIITNGPQFPSPVNPANTFTSIQVGKTISYNPITEIGTGSTTSYDAGTGTSCSGAALVNTANAPVTGTGTSSFVISQKGSRSDVVGQTITNEPISDLGDYVGNATLFRQ